MIESDLGTKFWSHQDRIDNRIISLMLPNANRLFIMIAIFTRLLFLLYLDLLS